MDRLQESHPPALPPGQPVQEAMYGTGAAVVLSFHDMLGDINKLPEFSQVSRRDRGPRVKGGCGEWAQRSELSCSRSHREPRIKPGLNSSVYTSQPTFCPFYS